MSEIERQRDAALIGYNECRATIEDARRALGATAHEGLLLAAMRVTEQRDRLLEEREQWRLSSVCRIMKRDLEKTRIENDWLGERLDKMEMERDGARRSRAKIIEKYQYAVREMHKSTEQRDKLAEALRKLVLWADCASRYMGNSHDVCWEAKEALAAVKGGSDE
jgi:hypothetical protein